MREVLSNFLAGEASKNQDFFVLSGDHGYALFDEIRRKAPKQFINTGVTEQGMIGCAAGMAKTGKKVVVYGLASFIPMRVLEFIKMNICYENLPIIILGDGAGTVYTTLGASHQCGEDIACLKTLPVKIYSPADKYEMKACLEDAMNSNMPCYIRIGKSDKPAIHKSFDSFHLSPAIKMNQAAEKLAVFATGSMVSTAVEINKKHAFSLYSCPILSHFNEEKLLEEVRKFQEIVTIEEHSIHGGLGSIISDVIVKNGLGIKVHKLGISKYFTKGCGSYDYATKFHELDFDSINKYFADYFSK